MDAVSPDTAVAARARRLNILILEDEATDAELMQRALHKAGTDFTARRVDTRADFVAALQTFMPDVVLADYKLPDFTGADALAYVRHVHPEIPVVMVTGTLGDEGAIELLKAGAKDYVLKSNLVRLPSAVERAIAVEDGIRARKAAEQAVRHSEERFRTLAEAAQDAIIIIDAADRVIYWNPAAERMLGYSAGEALGRKVHDWLAPPRFREAAMAGLKVFAATGRGAAVGKTVELAALRKDGTEIPIELSLAASQVGGGWQAIGIIRDITERKRAESAARESQQLIEGILNTIPVRVFWKDKSLVYLGCNAEFARDAGFAEPKDIVGKNDYQMVWRDRAELYRADDRQVIESGHPKLLIEEPLTTPAGDTLAIQTNKIPLRDATGEIAGVLGTYQDITERKRAADTIRESEAKFRGLVEQRIAGVVAAFDDGTIGYVNPYFADLLGYPAAAIIGRPLLEFVADSDKARVAERFHAMVAGEVGFVQIEHGFRKKDGATLEVLVNTSRVAYEGRPAAIGVVVDVTERKRAEQAMARLNRTLRTLSRGNEIVVRATDETQLMHEMCRAIVEVGGYRMAWIGMAEHDKAKSVRPAAWAGEVGHYLEKARITWAEAPRGNGPHGRAIRSGAPQITQDLAGDPSMAPWRAEARKCGFAASVALPLKNDEVFALLMIYATDAGAFDEAALKLLQEMADDLAYGIRALREHAAHEALNERWRTSLEATIGAIAATVDLRDPYTAGHQQRVARLAVAIARALKMSEHQIEGLYLAGIIHDVGKVITPAEILNKPGKLNKLEFQLIQAHAETGYDIVKGVDFPWPIAEMVLQHHERLDGSGYPQGLKGGQILPEAKILAVADVVEAMMSHRPYRPSLGQEAALAEVARGKGAQYDPAAVDACLALFRDEGFTFG